MRPEAGAHLWDAAEAAKNIELLGEALNGQRRDDPETAARVPGLDKIIGMRNIIALS